MQKSEEQAPQLAPELTAAYEKLERFKQVLMASSKERVQTLSSERSYRIADKQGAEHTFAFRPLTMQEWIELEDAETEILRLMAKQKDRLKTAEQLDYTSIVADAKTEITKAVVALMIKAAKCYLEIDEGTFQTLNYRTLVEVLAACKFKTENGDPNA